MLALVGEALQKETRRSNKAPHQRGIVRRVYAVILQIVQLEIIESRKNLALPHDECSMRTLIIAAFRECFPDWEKPFPTIPHLEAR